MFSKYIAGKNITQVFQRAKYVMANNRIPIINYAIEYTADTHNIYNEYEKISKVFNQHHKVAIKLSAFKYNKAVINSIINMMKYKDIQVIIDAEEGLDNDIYQEMTNELLYEHNQDFVNLVKTYQMYRKDSLDQLIDDVNFCKERNLRLGTKLVRGAYWNDEKNDGHLFTDKKDTDKNFDKGLLFLSDNNKYGYNMLATHNDKSIRLGVDLNNKSKIRIFDFAHLLGMNERYYDKMYYENVCVYLPYGPYKKMLPYLIRRLYENLDTIKYMFH